MSRFFDPTDADGSATPLDSDPGQAPVHRHHRHESLSWWSAALVALAMSLAATPCAAGQSTPDHATSKVYNTALGVECTHCHAAGDSKEEPATLDFARRMARMVEGLNDGPLRGLGPIDCWTCHRGRTVPARLPRALWESIVRTTQHVFQGRPEGLDITMGVYAASLNVACTHCHVENDWANPARPPHAVTARMVAIFELIPRYFDPAHRMPRTQCYMCHQGSTRIPRRPAASGEAPAPARTAPPAGTAVPGPY